jgi:type II secretory pathway pseudopilin PulG
VRHPDSGLTFLELIFAIAILGIMMTAFFTLVVQLGQNYNDQVAIAETQQSVRVALSLFSNEVQRAGFDPKGNSFAVLPTNPPTHPTKSRHAPLFNNNKDCSKEVREASPIMEASEAVFHFMGDKNGNGTFEKNVDDGEDIRYEWVGSSGKAICGREKKDPNTLYRDTGGGMQEVASGIEAFTLVYYDENSVPLPSGPLAATDRGRIRRIEVTVRGRIGEGDKKRELTSAIVLKNRG